MCIINLPAQVSNTRILVAPDADKNRQITVYSNKVGTEDNNVMILPAPYPSSIQFVDLSDYSSIFSDLNMSFEQPTLSYGLSTNCLSRSADTIKVVDVGSYQCSIIPSYRDIDRVDPKVFGIVQDHIKKILKQHYPSFGFVMCRLKPGTSKYHPIAYSHKMLTTGKLFVPTRHQHNNHGRMSFFSPMMDAFGYPLPVPNLVHDDETEADWDHEIYSFNTNSRAGNKTVTDKHLYFKKQKVPEFDFGKIHTLNKLEIKGEYDNRDVILGLA